MDREIIWAPLLWPGCEHLHIREDGSGATAGGLIIAVVGGSPVRVSYEVTCDRAWRTRRLQVDVSDGAHTTLIRDDDDRWRDPAGQERTDLAGCTDVDIALTPSTNTLPIRRLGLRPGESADIRTVYVRFEPSLTVTTSEQRYTRLGSDAAAGYTFESGSFSADLPVDPDGIVIDYPGLFRRDFATASVGTPLGA